MDITLISFILQAGDGPALTWQAFVLGNGAFLLGLAYWIGVQSNKIANLKERQREDHAATVTRLAELDENNQEVVVATLGEKMENLLDRIDMLQKDFDDFQKSVFVEALRIGTKKED